jgi:hypothetical protein
MYFFEKVNHVEGIKAAVGILVSTVLFADNLGDFEVKRIGKNEGV